MKTLKLNYSSQLQNSIENYNGKTSKKIIKKVIAVINEKDLIYAFFVTNDFNNQNDFQNCINAKKTFLAANYFEKPNAKIYAILWALFMYFKNETNRFF